VRCSETEAADLSLRRGDLSVLSNRFDDDSHLWERRSQTRATSVLGKLLTVPLLARSKPFGRLPRRSVQASGIYANHYRRQLGWEIFTTFSAQGMCRSQCLSQSGCAVQKTRIAEDLPAPAKTEASFLAYPGARNPAPALVMHLTASYATIAFLTKRITPLTHPASSLGWNQIRDPIQNHLHGIYLLGNLVSSFGIQGDPSVAGAAPITITSRILTSVTLQRQIAGTRI
jgi:hypothetical protein